jgi:Glycosyl hydrolase family 76
VAPIFLKQYGARRTGSNLLRLLLTENFPDVVVLMHVLGDKHSPPPPFAELWSRAAATADPAYEFTRAATLRSPAETTDPASASQEALVRALATPLVRAMSEGRFGFLVSLRDPYAWAAGVLRYYGWAPHLDVATGRLAEWLGLACAELNHHCRTWLRLEAARPVPLQVIRLEDLRNDAPGVLDGIASLLELVRPVGGYRLATGEVLPPAWDDEAIVECAGRFDPRRTPVLPPLLEETVTASIDWEMLAPFGYAPRHFARQRRRSVAMSQDSMQDATACVQVLTSRWLTPSAPGAWVPQDYWKTPTMCQELVTYMSLAGSQQFLTTCDNARDASLGYLTSSGWLDDATTWGRYFVWAHRWLAALGSADAQQYLDLAGTVYRNLCSLWGTTCGGGLQWERSDGESGNFWASNSTLGLMEIAAGLHAATGEPDQLAWARKAWTWLKDKGLIDAQGLVWGGLDQQTCQRLEDNIPVIGLQGDAIGSVWELYAGTGDPSLLDAAEHIVSGTLAAFTWPGTQIFNTPFDGEWPSQSPDWQWQHVNDTLFKGVFAGYLGDFATNLARIPGREAVAASYVATLEANAEALKANFPGGVYGMDWHTSQSDYQETDRAMLNACLQFSALSVFDAVAKTASGADQSDPSGQ